MRKSFPAISVAFVLLFLFLLMNRGGDPAYAGNMDPDKYGYSYAYGENVGWINLDPSYGDGVTVTDSAVMGYAWGENIGWINLSPASGGVLNDGLGNLYGYAWGENVGWINFAPTGGGVIIDPATGIFYGKAWGENIGWISFDSTEPVSFQVKTSWKGDTTPPVLMLPSNMTVAATSASGAVVKYTATATDNLPGVTVACTPASGSAFPLGTTTVTCTATDAAGNTTTGSFTVTVNIGTPRFSGKIVAQGWNAPGVLYVDIRFTNDGTGNAQNISLNRISLRTLSGSGTVTYNTMLSPALPYGVGNLDIGGTITVRLYFNVPFTVTRFSITETGALQNVIGTNYSFSIAQATYPPPR